MLERTFAGYSGNLHPALLVRQFTDLARSAELSSEAVETISWARRVRNELVHGIEVPAPAYLNDGADRLEKVLSEIENTPNKSLKKAYLDAKGRLQGKKPAARLPKKK